MQIRRINTEHRGDVQRYVDFPFQLYRDCPQWVPPLVSSVEHALNRRRHPFYRHSTASFFVAESEGQTLGRIAVMHNRNYNSYRQANVAFFGYFEVVQDIQVARALLEAALDWARAQDMDAIIGPKGLIGSDTGGVLVDGFEHRPAMGVPYNFPYYDAFIRDSGFGKDTDYVSGYLSGDHQLPHRFYRIADRVKARSGFRVKTFRSRREIRRWVPRIIAAHREAFSHTHTYYPPTDGEVALIFDTLISVVDPRLAKIVMKDEKIVGFILAYHDVSAALQKTQGRLWPFGWYALWRERKRTTWVNVNGLGILPAYRGLGGNALLYTELLKAIKACGFEHIDLVQVEEGNHKSLAEMKAIGVKWYKRHRGYKRTL